MCSWHESWNVLQLLHHIAPLGSILVSHHDNNCYLTDAQLHVIVLAYIASYPGCRRQKYLGKRLALYHSYCVNFSVLSGASSRASTGRVQRPGGLWTQAEAVPGLRASYVTYSFVLWAIGGYCRYCKCLRSLTAAQCSIHAATRPANLLQVNGFSPPLTSCRIYTE